MENKNSDNENNIADLYEIEKVVTSRCKLIKICQILIWVTR